MINNVYMYIYTNEKGHRISAYMLCINGNARGVLVYASGYVSSVCSGQNWRLLERQRPEKKRKDRRSMDQT